GAPPEPPPLTNRPRNRPRKLPSAKASMLGTVSPLSPLAPLAAADPSASTLHSSVIPPIVVLVMCVVDGVGTVMLLPSRRETPLRKIGGAVVLAAALVFAALLVRG